MNATDSQSRRDAKTDFSNEMRKSSRLLNNVFSSYLWLRRGNNQQTNNLVKIMLLLKARNLQKTYFLFLKLDELEIENNFVFASLN